MGMDSSRLENGGGCSDTSATDHCPCGTRPGSADATVLLGEYSNNSRAMSEDAATRNTFSVEVPDESAICLAEAEGIVEHGLEDRLWVHERSCL